MAAKENKFTGYNIKRPKSVIISPYRLKTDFFSKTPVYWINNDPFLTHYFNALSLLFPEGERYFMDSVKLPMERNKDEQLNKDVRIFIAQEGLHGSVHDKLNTFLKQVGGYQSIDAMIRLTKTGLDLAKKHLSNSQNLAITIGLEHITAILAEELLVNTELSLQIHDTVRPTWLWHAIEEIEHKAVAYDVYDITYYQNYFERVFFFYIATIILLVVLHSFQAKLLHEDKELFNLKMWSEGLWKLYGYKGYISGLFIEWLRYFKPGFHPWQKDNSSLLTLWKKELLDK